METNTIQNMQVISFMSLPIHIILQRQQQPFVKNKHKIKNHSWASSLNTHVPYSYKITTHEITKGFKYHNHNYHWVMVETSTNLEIEIRAYKSFSKLN